jgi:hypothetical protein
MINQNFYTKMNYETPVKSGHAFPTSDGRYSYLLIILQVNINCISVSGSTYNCLYNQNEYIGDPCLKTYPVAIVLSEENWQFLYSIFIMRNVKTGVPFKTFTPDVGLKIVEIQNLCCSSHLNCPR